MFPWTSPNNEDSFGSRSARTHLKFTRAPPSIIDRPKERAKVRLIEINDLDEIVSFALTADAKHIVSGSSEGEIQRWRIKDRKEVWRPIQEGYSICSLAVPLRRAKWVISGRASGTVSVWDGKRHKKAIELRGHKEAVRAIDASPDGARVATGSNDSTVRVWSLSTGEQLLSPLKHVYELAAVKFSPDGRLIATATWRAESVRLYESQSGNLLVDVPIGVNSAHNQCLAWTSNSQKLYVLSGNGHIICLRAPDGAALSRWRIHSEINPICISIASNDRFVAASAKSSVSFWDTETHEQVGPVVKIATGVWSMAISAKFELVTSGKNKMSFSHLRGILPSRYFDAAPARLAQGVKTDTRRPEPLQTQAESTGTTVGSLHHAAGTPPLIHASDAVLASWRKDKLLEGIQALSQETREDQHVLATRAFLRARLRQWDFAIKDARKSIAIQPTILAYVALSMAHFTRGNVKRAQETFTRLFHKCDVEDVCFVLLIKAIVVFTSGYHQEGLARLNELILACEGQDIASYRAVHAQMCLLTARACIGRQEYDNALDLLADAQAHSHLPNHPQLDCVCMMFGWTNNSDELRFHIYQQRCEVLSALGRQKEAEKIVATVLNGLAHRLDSTPEMKDWLQDFTRRCPTTPPKAGDVVVNSIASPST